MNLGAQVLPPPPPETLATPLALFVQSFRFEGNRAFSEDELAGLVEPYTGRVLESDEIEEARRVVTMHYVNHGYVNSGAVLPDQDPTNGVVTLQIVEGKLTEIRLQGNRWLRDRYITGRIERWADPVLNLTELQEGLQLLQENPNVSRINAELKPGASPGASVLDLQIKDRQPFRVGVQIDNQRPPSVGAEQISLLASDLNLTGHSDPLHLRYGVAHAGPDGLEFSGADNMEGSYQLPITRHDTTLSLSGSRLNTSIIEEQFLSLFIRSLTTSYGLVLRQPLYQSARQEFAVSIGLEHRLNESWLLDEPFSISPGAVDGEMVVTVLRLSQDWMLRGQNHVLALRSTFSLGLDAWGATDNGVSGDPDAVFFSWLGQAQYIQRVFNTQNQIVLRAAGQWSAERLLALEQMSVGGFDTVRGYLENQLVRDRGFVSSIEFRLPVLFDKSGAGIVSVAPFFDFGGAWGVDDSPSPSTIYSTGIGVRMEPCRHFSADVYWGYRLRDVDIPDDAGAQGHGFGFRINLMAL